MHSSKALENDDPVGWKSFARSVADKVRQASVAAIFLKLAACADADSRSPDNFQFIRIARIHTVGSMTATALAPLRRLF